MAIITRFGDTYASAYVLPTLRGEQPQDATRTPVVAAVSGADGEFDFFGDNAFPLAPKELLIKGDLQASSYGAINTALETLKIYTLSRGISKLWQITRDTAAAVPIRWAWAKCNSAQESEIAGKQFTNYPVSLVFHLSEGVWYGETAHTLAWPSIGSQYFANYGTYYNPPINVSAKAEVSPLIFVKATVRGFAIVGGAYWMWTDKSSVAWWDAIANGVADGNLLVLDSAALAVTNAGADAYADSAGNPQIFLGSRQVGWLGLGATEFTLDGYVQISAIAGGNIISIVNTTPIAVQTAMPHGLVNGQRVTLTATGITDGSFVITVTGASTFALNGTAASGTGTVGRWRLGIPITGVTSSGTPVTITTGFAHGLTNSDVVSITDTQTDADGVWQVDNVGTYTARLKDDISGTYPAYNIRPWRPSPAGYLDYNPGATALGSYYDTFVS